ncbi:SixA phosphatase family protein [Hydrogenophaga sp. A37]|uniref:SixA phosphatase family protein n=1 Tax=Hydrogenophaga sp. A37 TaxID=1945864 RepID=UPI0009841A8F|nr:histidine phosphatase family protein [Hydrogenophaga sp. A37]OOG79367.1 histidine phosphatase family protein [Hydrogenophaga sp. A37]
MDLILWRHAEAHEHPEGIEGLQGDALDLERRLTPRGEKQAARMGAWLDRQLPEGARVYASPAQRAQQTAAALGRKFRTRDELLPGAELESVLALVGWPDGRSPVVVIGHQPTLGQVIARLLRLPEPECPMKKGALWWLRNRERAGRMQNLLVTVQTPELT